MSPQIEIRTVAEGSELEHVRTLLRSYNEHLCTFIDPALLHHREEELAGLPANFTAPDGALLLASEEGRALGCIGLRLASLRDEQRIGEICRLWVSPEARGCCLGQRLLEAAIAIARRAKYKAVVLNTIHGSMDAAQSLYHRSGFQQIPAYKQVAIPNVAFYRLELAE